MRIICEINDDVIKKACYLVGSHYRDPDFIYTLSYSEFNMVGEREPSRDLFHSEGLFYVRTYKTFNPWSKAIAHYSNGVCYINTRKSFGLEDRVETIFHEICGHGLGFQHKGNRVTAYNLETFPYKGARLFVQYLKDKGVL